MALGWLACDEGLVLGISRDQASLDEMFSGRRLAAPAIPVAGRDDDQDEDEAYFEGDDDFDDDDEEDATFDEFDDDDSDDDAEDWKDDQDDDDDL